MANKKKGQDDERQFQGQIRAGVLFPVASSGNQMPDDYRSLLAELKERIVSERLRITFAANAAMIMLYWDIGRTILRRQKHEGWGAKVIDRLSADLHDAFPDMQGLSPRNLNPTTTHNAVSPMPLVFVSDERHKPDSSSSVSMRQAQ